MNSIKTVAGPFALVAVMLLLPASSKLQANEVGNWVETRFDHLEASIGSPLPETIDDLVKFAVIPNSDDPQHHCLAQAVYFEARSEPVAGQIAVARVVMNRVADPRYPNTICGVVFQNQQWVDHCQFSFACDGRSDNPHEPAAWAMASRIASLVERNWVPDPIGDATYYHANYVKPSWADKMVKTATVGSHIFYSDNPNDRDDVTGE